MDENLPESLRDLIGSLSKLPGIGVRTAERFAYFLLKANPQISTSIAEDLQKLHTSVKLCPKTFALIDIRDDYSNLYDSPKRDKKIVMVVAEPFDIYSIEKTGVYKGTYHVLGGLLSPIEGVMPENLRIAPLKNRIREDRVEEIILGLNANIEGESTSLLIIQELADFAVKITRLARGLSAGADLEYADSMSLRQAFEGRTIMG